MHDAHSPAPQALASGFGRCRILVLGDVMLDVYIYGEVERVSPEAPIPVMRVVRRSEMLGGAGNVARNIASLGATAILLGVIGEDEAGGAARRLLGEVAKEASGKESLGGIEDRLVAVPSRPTTRKTRFVAGGQQLLRADEETSAALVGDQESATLAAFDAALAEADLVILSDYAKGVLTPTLLKAVIARAKAAGKQVIADPKSTDFSRYAEATILTPNRLEVARATGIDGRDDDATEAAGRKALAAARSEAIIVTRSELGLSIVPRVGEVVHLPTRAREVFDVSGAGDTLVAALAVALAAGHDLAEAAGIANAAAGIAVAKPGTAVVTPRELAQTLHLGELLATDRKVATLEEATERVAEWRASGLKVGFTNGCFDLIHPGHVRLLAKARAACDRLIVGLNTDASVQRLKGETRPIQNEVARATVMASIGAVDLVVPFSEDTPLALIDALRPDLLVKGADYTIDKVVGADRVQAHGGRVLLVDLEAGHSTTGTIGRIKKDEAARQPKPPAA